MHLNPDPAPSTVTPHLDPSVKLLLELERMSECMSAPSQPSQIINLLAERTNSEPNDQGLGSFGVSVEDHNTV